jgi:N-acetylglucosaminyldiphosphoundecaprenol N-acetyl-beta-D-mannosaminyltransferase
MMAGRDISAIDRAAAAAPSDAAASPRRWDATFQRDVVCVLGVPLDIISLDDAVDHIRACGFGGQRCFISTPNLNFAVAASKDTAFRESLLHSDLSLVDGMPLVWVARCLGLPIRERVSGADLFERLAAHPGPALRVFFFGGPPGAAEQACRRLNQNATGAHAVGFNAAGFGSLDDMSAGPVVEQINGSGAHFVIVALGAQKGQAWIERNRARLSAPLVSHLGAVVNFVAGHVQRAPEKVQRLGMEWLWRIKEQPDLWRRYWNDGALLVRWMIGRVVPLRAWMLWRRLLRPKPVAPRLHVAHLPDAMVVTLRGDWCREALGPLRAVLSEAAGSPSMLRLDLADVTWVDSAFVGLIQLARGVYGAEPRLSLHGPSAAVRRIFRLCGAEHLIARATTTSCASNRNLV